MRDRIRTVQLSTRQGFPQNILEVPQGDLVGHPSRCSDSLARHWLWRLYSRSAGQVVPGYQTGTLKATGLSYSKPGMESPYTGGQCGAGGRYIATLGHTSRHVCLPPLFGVLIMDCEA